METPLPDPSPPTPDPGPPPAPRRTRRRPTRPARRADAARPHSTPNLKRPEPGRLAPMARSYDRSAADLRPVSIDPGFVRTATGSCLYEQGETRVICTASVSDPVPRWLEGKGRGWVTAEYAMLPASTGERKERDFKRGRPDGRSTEIQRLIGRSLRGVVDLRRWPSARSTSTATSCRPTAAPAAPRSPAATSPCGWRLEAARGRRARARPADRLGRGDLLRGRRRRGALRPRLLRGLAAPRSTPTSS